MRGRRPAGRGWRRTAPPVVPALLLAACEIAAVTPAPPTFAPIASSTTDPSPSSAAAAPSAVIELSREVALWCRQNVEDVYAVTEGLGIPSDPRPFRARPDDDAAWRPIEGSRNYQAGCTAAYEERASAAPS